MDFMKSRVNKYADLHQKIASDAESTVENSDLSHFANRLNEIDDQFERVNTGSHETILPNRARKNDVEDSDKVDPMVDTFETDYLKGFLDEVKEYNVKKGYRDISDTQANILDDLRAELTGKAQEEKAKIQEKFAQTQSIYSEKELAKIADELIKEEKEMDNFDLQKEADDETEDLNDTLVFGQEISIHSQDDEVMDNVDEKKVLKQMDPSKLVLNMSDQEQEETDQPAKEENISEAIQGMSYDNEEEDFEEEFEEEFSLGHRADKREVDLFEQTLSLQHKVLDLENNIEEMSATTSKTNQLLHVVLSLLLFAIIVVALLIVAQFI